MKNTVKVIFWVVIAIGGIYVLSRIGGQSSSSSNYNPYTDTGDEYSNDDTFDYDTAISDHWDEIMPYINGSDTIEACSDSSGNCYDLEADISDGCVEEIHFDNGGYLDFSSACLDENGEAEDSDDEGNDWTFSVDTGSSIVTDAVDEWYSNYKDSRYDDSNSLTDY